MPRYRYGFGFSRRWHRVRPMAVPYHTRTEYGTGWPYDAARQNYSLPIFNTYRTDLPRTGRRCKALTARSVRRTVLRLFQQSTGRMRVRYGRCAGRTSYKLSATQRRTVLSYCASTPYVTSVPFVRLVRYAVLTVQLPSLIYRGLVKLLAWTSFEPAQRTEH